jgi:GNAT superfamily N-acetyltransferase
MTTSAGPADGPETTVVRAATAGDAEDVAAIWHAGWADGHLGNVPDELTRHRGRSQFLARARARVDATWVSTSSDLVTGFVVVVEDEVEQIYVESSARGTGVAAALLRRAEDELRAGGHPRAWLAVVAGNARARSFYEHHGWQDRGLFSYLAETENGPVEVPCHRYTIDLSQPGGSSGTTG